MLHVAKVFLVVSIANKQIDQYDNGHLIQPFQNTGENTKNVSAFNNGHRGEFTVYREPAFIVLEP